MTNWDKPIDQGPKKTWFVWTNTRGEEAILAHEHEVTTEGHLLFYTNRLLSHSFARGWVSCRLIEDDTVLPS